MMLQALLDQPAGRLVLGSKQGAGRRIVLKFDEATFQRVALLAAASNVSFAEAVRQLVKRGLVSNARAEAVGHRRDRGPRGEP